MIEIIIKYLVLITFIQYSSLLPFRDSSEISNYNKTSYNNRTNNTNTNNSDVYEYIQFKRMLIADFEDRVTRQLKDFGIEMNDIDIKTNKRTNNGVYSSCSNGMSKNDMIRASRHFEVKEETNRIVGEGFKKILIKLKKSNLCFISMDGSNENDHLHSTSSSSANSQPKSCFSGELPDIYSIKSIYSSRLIIPSTSLNETAVKYFNYSVSINDTNNNSPANIDLELPIYQINGDSDINSSSYNYTNIINNNNKDLQYNITELMSQVIRKKQNISIYESASELYRTSVTQLFNLLLVKQYNSRVQLDQIIDFNNILLEIHYKKGNSSLNRSKRNTVIHESLLQNKGECSDDSLSCCRNYIWIQFKNLKFGQYIFAPASFKLYYCERSCPTVLGFKSAGQHPTVLPRRHQPCCAPNSYQFMRVVARSDHNTIKFMSLPTALVGSCRCL